MSKSIPFGYRVVNGLAIIDEIEGKYINDLFDAYLNYRSIGQAAIRVEPNLKNRASARKILMNSIYLGTDFYPQIIEKEKFNKAQKILIERRTVLGAGRKPTNDDINYEIKRYTFVFPKNIKIKIFDDPCHQAEYVYSQIKEKFNER